MTGIYLITNEKNGKIYVGQALNIEKRIKQHVIDSKNKRKISVDKAIFKYGWTTFSWKVLKECNPMDLDTFEQFFIRVYCSWKAKIGYNRTLGGNYAYSNRKIIRKPWTNEQKLRVNMSEKIKQKYDDPEYRRKNEASQEKRVTASHTEEASRKRSESVKKWWAEHRNSAEVKSRNKKISLNMKGNTNGSKKPKEVMPYEIHPENN
jgi:group I intron endonuclease